MRRQSASTAKVLTGENCALRLDPFELPARVTFHNESRVGDVPQTAIIGRDSIMIRRQTGAGVPLYMTVPVRMYAGILLRVHDGPNDTRVALHLHHANHDLGVPLLEASDTDEVIADWQAWGRSLRRPLLMENADGVIDVPCERLGGVILKRPRARRANRFFAERRPRFLCRRRIGGALPDTIHRDDEIIAWDATD